MFAIGKQVQEQKTVTPRRKRRKEKRKQRKGEQMQR
jgi:hypothetical protein